MSKRPFRTWRHALTTMLVLLSCMAMASAQQNQTNPDVDVLHVRGPIYVISAGGSNITASIGIDGVLLVDTGPAELSEKVVAAIVDIQRSLQPAVIPSAGGAETRSNTLLLQAPRPPIVFKPVSYILNTNAHPDHNGGNIRMAKAPREISSQAPNEIATRIHAHENVLLRLSGAEGGRAVPYESWPSDVYSAAYYKLTSYFNGEGVQLIHIPKANTDGDSLVWFRTSDVIAAGDIYRTDAYPTPNLEMGGNIQGVIEGLNTLVDMAIPEYRAEGGTLIVPGHGRISDQGDVANYRDLITIIRDRVDSMIKKGMTLEQIQAARPNRDYDGRYAAAPGAANQFIASIYRSLTTSGSQE